MPYCPCDDYNWATDIFEDHQRTCPVALTYAERDALKLQNQELQKKLEMAGHVERCAIINEVWGPSSKASRDWLVGKMKEQDRLYNEALERIIEAKKHATYPCLSSPPCDCYWCVPVSKPDLRPKDDTCENVRGDDGKVKGKFCETFMSSKYPAHSPTCQFYPKPDLKREDPVQYCLCPVTTATIKEHRESCHLYEKRIDKGPTCTMCGWCNRSNHVGGARKMYTMGTVTKCGECLPRTR